jgi:hypothetical protein
VRGPVHASLVTGTRRLMAASAFVAWESPAADLPPTWAAADERLGAPAQPAGTVSSPVRYCARPKPNDQSSGPFST